MQTFRMLAFHNLLQGIDFLLQTSIYSDLSLKSCIQFFINFIERLDILLFLGSIVFLLVLLKHKVHFKFLLFINIISAQSCVSSVMLIITVDFLKQSLFHGRYNLSGKSDKIGVSFKFMKKVKSPLKENQSNLSLSIKRNIKQELQKPYKPITDILSSAQQEQKNKNNQSIRKVMKELTDLKKELRQLKNQNKSTVQGLDMSLCRKAAVERKQSSSPHRKHTYSHSSSKNKSNSQQKDISTQTKPKNNEINEFSFSVDSKSGGKQQKLLNQSEEQDSQDHEYSLRKKSQMSTKRAKQYKKREEFVSVSENITDRVAAIEASELYQRHLNSIKHSMDTIQISSAFLSTEDKLKLNIQVERLSKNISRIPIYMSKQQQYYQTIQLYARNLNNQLNNFVFMLNRAQEQPDRLRWRYFKGQAQQKLQKLQICQNCDQNQRKGAEKAFRKQVRRYEKTINKLQLELERKQDEISKTSQLAASLLKEIEQQKQGNRASLQQRRELEQKIKELRIEQEEAMRTFAVLQKQKQQEQRKAKFKEEELKFYQLQLEKTKEYKEDQSRRKQQQQLGLQSKNKELQIIAAEIKAKQTLYQAIIQEKQNNIQELKEKVNTQFNHSSPHHSKSKKKHIDYDSEQDSIDSAEFYRQKAQLKQKSQQCSSQQAQIGYLKQSKLQLEFKNKEILSKLQLCLQQIDRLHSEIDVLHESNQKLKDRCLKSKILTEKKQKREIETQVSKQSTFKEINELIKQHKDALAKEKK